VATLTAALVALLNRVLVADRIDPADLDAVHAASVRARDTISLGLDWTSDGDPAHARAVLATTPVVDLFRVGYSLTAALGRRAVRLEREGVIEPVLDPLVEPRPLFPRALDPQPRDGARPFRSVADVRAADACLTALEAAEAHA
jgi:hypothetical protein